MTSLFENHEKQYGNITSEITFHLGQLVTQIREKPEDSKKHLTKIETLFIDAKDILQQMELEMGAFETSLRPKYKNRWQSHTKELENLEKEFKNVRSRSTRGTNDDGDWRDDVDSDPKLKLIRNSDRLERAGNRLEEGYRIAVETEHIGTQILDDLGEQREKITRSRDRLRETNEDLATSSRLLTKMTRKVINNRLILAVLAIVMFLIIAVCIYLVVRKTTTTTTTTTSGSTGP